MSNSLILDKECLEVARKQFCLDVGLPWEEYCASREQSVFICKNTFVAEAGKDEGKSAWGETEDAQKQAGARVYAGRSSFFRAIICLGQLFICCDEQIYDWIMEQYGQCKPEWFCNFQNLRKLDEKLKEFGHQIQDTHVFFLPEAGMIDKTDEMLGTTPGAEERSEDATFCQYQWFEQSEILRFKDNNCFTSAICFWEGTPDVLAVAKIKKEYLRLTNNEKTFDQSRMAGMAGASRDGAYLWQIGINVDKEYAGQGLGYELVRMLKEEILHRGKVPFYGTSESHTISQTVGLKAGFVPAWTEVWVREI